MSSSLYTDHIIIKSVLMQKNRAGFTLVEALCGVVVEAPLSAPSPPLPSLSPSLPFLPPLPPLPPPVPLPSPPLRSRPP